MEKASITLNVGVETLVENRVQDITKKTGCGYAIIGFSLATIIFMALVSLDIWFNHITTITLNHGYEIDLQQVDDLTTDITTVGIISGFVGIAYVIVMSRKLRELFLEEAGDEK